VKEALENDCTHIVFEQLKGVRERLPHAKAVHKWAFHRLYEYVTYKAESKGVEVKQINPEYTSQRCSKCGFTHEDNRPHNNRQDEFECLKCGYEVHADYNAAKNIGLKYLRDQQKSGRGRRTRRRALEQRDVEREWRVFACPFDGLERSSR